MMRLLAIGRRIGNRMSSSRREPNITEILSDSIIKAVMEADVTPIGRAPERRLLALAVGETQRRAMTLEHRLDVGHEPACVTRLERDSLARSESRQRGVEKPRVDLHAGWQLDQRRPALTAQLARPLEKALHRLFRIVQALQVREEAAHLQSECEVRGRSLLPLLENGRFRQVIEGVVDLGGLKTLGEVLEPARLRELRGVERAAPVGVLPAGGPDVKRQASPRRTPAPSSSSTRRRKVH